MKVVDNQEELVANEIFNSLGPEKSFEVSQILHKLINDDAQLGIKQSFEHINAHNMRKISDKDYQDINTFLYRIEAAARKHEYEICIYNCDINKENKETLEKFGFKVKIEPNMDYVNTVISWADVISVGILDSL